MREALPPAAGLGLHRGAAFGWCSARGTHTSAPARGLRSRHPGGDLPPEPSAVLRGEVVDADPPRLKALSVCPDAVMGGKTG